MDLAVVALIVIAAAAHLGWLGGRDFGRQERDAEVVRLRRELAQAKAHVALADAAPALYRLGDT